MRLEHGAGEREGGGAMNAFFVVKVMQKLLFSFSIVEPKKSTKCTFDDNDPDDDSDDAMYENGDGPPFELLV